MDANTEMLSGPVERVAQALAGSVTHWDSLTDEERENYRMDAREIIPMYPHLLHLDEREEWGRRGLLNTETPSWDDAVPGTEIRATFGNSAVEGPITYMRDGWCIDLGIQVIPLMDLIAMGFQLVSVTKKV